MDDDSSVTFLIPQYRVNITHVLRRIRATSSFSHATVRQDAKLFTSHLCENNTYNDDKKCCIHHIHKEDLSKIRVNPTNGRSKNKIKKQLNTKQTMRMNRDLRVFLVVSATFSLQTNRLCRRYNVPLFLFFFFFVS